MIVSFCTWRMFVTGIELFALCDTNVGWCRYSTITVINDRWS